MIGIFSFLLIIYFLNRLRNKKVLNITLVILFFTNVMLYIESFNHLKNNFVQWSTADSEPILQNFKDWAEKCPNLWFWASFAQRCLNEENKEKYGHCKTLYGSIDSK